MPQMLEEFTEAFDVFVNDFLRKHGYGLQVEAMKTASYEDQDVFKPRNHIDLFYMFVGTLNMLQSLSTDIKARTLNREEVNRIKSKLERAEKQYKELQDKYFKVVDEYTEKQAKSSRKQRRRNRQQENQPEGMRSLMCALQKMRTSQ